MREPRLAEMEAGEVEEFYAEPDVATLETAADYLRSMERVGELVDSYRDKQRKYGMTEELLEQGYEPDEHVGFYRPTEESHRVLDNFVVDDRRTKLEEDMEWIEQELLEELGELRTWEEIEEGDGPVKAVTVAYGVVNDTFSPGADADEAIETLRERSYEDYELLDRYASERDSLTAEADALDRFVSRGGTFQRDGLFGTVTDLMLDWEHAIDRLYEEEEVKGRQIVETAQERREQRASGDEPVQPWDYDLAMELQEEKEPSVTASDEDLRYLA